MKDIMFYFFLILFAGWAMREMVTYRKSSRTDCHFCKRRGMWYKWKDKQGLPRPICNSPGCIDRALEEKMMAVWV